MRSGARGLLGLVSMRLLYHRSSSRPDGQCLPRRVVDEVVWVKMTVHQRLAKSHGYYLQHAKEARTSRGDLTRPEHPHAC